MSAIVALSLHLFREQARSRAFLLVLLFGAAMVYASLLAGVLAVDQEQRVLLDLGLGLLELTVLATVVYGASTAVLQEMESKTIYLILSRPISKWQYLAGRYGGLVLTTALAAAAMGLVHVTLLLAKGWAWDWGYPVWLAGSVLKAAVAAALATLFALISTSAVSAVVMTGFLWAVGHFLPELTFLASRGGSKWLLKPVLYLAPNLQLLNFRDHWETGHLAAQVAGSLGYGALYALAALLFASVLFERKEF